MIKYIKVYHNLIRAVNELSDAEAGRLFKAMLAYGFAGEAVTLPGAERLVFAMIREQIDSDRKSYGNVVERNHTNGLKGGRPRKPNETEKNPMGFLETQNKEKEEEEEAYTRARECFIADDDAAAIMEGHNQVFDRAKACGFDLNTHTMDALADLIGKHGVDRLLTALADCAEHGAKTLAYLRKVLDGKPKQPPRGDPPALGRLF